MLGSKPQACGGRQKKLRAIGIAMIGQPEKFLTRRRVQQQRSGIDSAGLAHLFTPGRNCEAKQQRNDGHRCQ